MRTLLCILLIIGCNSQTKQTDATNQQTTSTNKQEKLQYYTTIDTVVITTDLNDSLRFSKNLFNKIIDEHPEFTTDFIQSPDNAYACNGDNDFNSEAGQDTYYILYAYFLKQKNSIEKYSEYRKKLIDIYSDINSLFGHLEYGGTHFGHQCSRILGYAEYSIYLYRLNEDNSLKTYDIRKQKELYIKSLRQLINDESKIDFQSIGEKKIARNKKLNKIVDKIDKALTNIFYLRRAQEFHYEHYGYW